MSKFNKMGESRPILVQGVVNLLLTCIVALPVLLYFLIGKPTKRGFFCDDESLRHPYQSSTVSNLILYIYGFLVPLAAVLLVEILGRNKLPKLCPLKIGKSTVPSVLVNIYFVYVGFLFGAAMSQCITDVCKYTVGRLRPHFFDVCKPDYNNFNCTGEGGQSIFVTTYECSGNLGLFDNDQKEVDARIKEAHISFVSGHASFSFQAAVFVFIYLQSRKEYFIPSMQRILLVPFFQFVVLATTVYISISRVMDNKHHPGDVIAGAILGTIVQIVNSIFIMKLFNEDKDKYTSVNNDITDMQLNQRRQPLRKHNSSERDIL